MGKSALAMHLAWKYHTGILSADSRQCYREMHIGVAAPSVAEMAEVPHFFVKTHSIHQQVTAATFAQYGRKVLDKMFQTSNIAIVAGGTGLYLKALLHGLDEIPLIPKAVCTQVRAGYEAGGLTWLQQQLAQHDKTFTDFGEKENPHRLMRALEVMLATGQPLAQWQQGTRLQNNFDTLWIGLDLPRKQLYESINARVDEMMRAGLLDEVKGLMTYKQLPALQTVGYRELFEYLDGLCSLDQAVENIKTNTRRYAKRQLTWFRNQETMRWFEPRETDAIEGYLAETILPS